MTSDNKLSETNTSLDAVHLKNSEEKAVYLESCLLSADTDAFVIAQALGEIARAVGMTKIAKETGLSRENLYQALSGERNPTLETFSCRAICPSARRFSSKNLPVVTSFLI